MANLWYKPKASWQQDPPIGNIGLLAETPALLDPEPYYDEDCCCVEVGLSCSGICDVEGTPKEVDVTFNNIPFEQPETCEIDGCSWLEGCTVRLQQDQFNPCKWCITFDEYCLPTWDLEVCFFLFLNVNAVYGRLQFRDLVGGVDVSDTVIEWQISPTAPIDCRTFNDTVTINSPFLSVEGSDPNHQCRYGVAGFSYTVKAATGPDPPECE